LEVGGHVEIAFVEEGPGTLTNGINSRLGIEQTLASVSG
jgi:hypothetical protein